MGNVHIFNLSVNPTQILMVNNLPIESGIGGWSTEAATKFVPLSVSVPRTPTDINNLDNAAFSQSGENHVHVRWKNGHQNVDLSIDFEKIDPQLDDDFLLYIAAQQSILFNHSGGIVELFDHSS